MTPEEKTAAVNALRAWMESQSIDRIHWGALFARDAGEELARICPKDNPMHSMGLYILRKVTESAAS